GNGPAALLLSYLLHGHLPVYAGGHHDSVLDSKLCDKPDLRCLTPDLYAHFHSSLRYSTQALPINTLLDTLIRPNADTTIDSRTCVDWIFRPDVAVTHAILGNAPAPGGQWTEDPVSASASIGTLSYAEMLSLPGYSFADHHQRVHGEPLPDFLRPSREEVASYFAAYPSAVGISDVIHNNCYVERISRTKDGFFIEPQRLQCKHLVLATGIFSINIPPPAVLRPLAPLHSDSKPLLVVGSGFSAADVIISAPPSQKIIHLYNWAPEERPSPLRGCHPQAYPEYAMVYRQMKQAAAEDERHASTPGVKRKVNPFAANRDWADVYEGLPNAEIVSVHQSDAERDHDVAHVQIRTCKGQIKEFVIGSFAYVVGRRGTLDYLHEDLRGEVLKDLRVNDSSLISGRTLRPKFEENNFEVTQDVFVIGSLAGDSLIRHAYGSCVFVGGKIMSGNTRRCCESNGDERERATPSPSSTSSTERLPRVRGGMAHNDLHIDRRQFVRGET
ncbi:hypothetical protein P152DRAFT_398948, partial [Eremomyces bilateralis CBS 781.70]